jgi:hypothetical protein
MELDKQMDVRDCVRMENHRQWFSLSNRMYAQGAVLVTDMYVPQSVRNILENDFDILPSSFHKLTIVPEVPEAYADSCA